MQDNVWLDENRENNAKQSSEEVGIVTNIIQLLFAHAPRIKQIEDPK